MKNLVGRQRRMTAMCLWIFQLHNVAGDSFFLKNSQSNSFLSAHEIRIRIRQTVAICRILVIYPMVNVNEASAWCGVPCTDVERVSQVHANPNFVS